MTSNAQRRVKWYFALIDLKKRIDLIIQSLQIAKCPKAQFLKIFRLKRLKWANQHIQSIFIVLPTKYWKIREMLFVLIFYISEFTFTSFTELYFLNKLLIYTCMYICYL